MVAPSLVTLMDLFLGPAETGTRILSIPLGPRVVLTRSATAIAPTKDDWNIKKEIRDERFILFISWRLT